MMSEKPLRCLLHRIPWLVRLCGYPVAYEKCDGLRKEVEKAVVHELFHNRLENGEIWLLTLYAKSDRSTIPAHELKMIKEVIDRE